MKKSNIIILVFAGIAIAGFIIYFVSRDNFVKDAGIEEAKDLVSCQNISVAIEKKRCIEVGYDAWLSTLMERALSEKNPDACQSIPREEDRDVCYLEMTGVVLDTALCTRITAEDRKADCEQRIAFSSADFASCKNFKNEIDRDYCYQRALSSQSIEDEKACGAFAREERNLCLETYYIALALKTADYDVCRKVPTDAGIQKCLKKMPLDSDKDGLSDYSEKVKYGTNPLNRDTDGDGFSDGTEVKSGHDPLK